MSSTTRPVLHRDAHGYLPGQRAAEAGLSPIGTRPAAARDTVRATTRTVAGAVRTGDVIRFKDGTHRLVSDRVADGDRVTFEFREDMTRVSVERAYPVTVVAEFDCDCKGTGTWGRGKHFACGGKGHQDRADRARNNAYWNANGGRAR